MFLVNWILFLAFFKLFIFSFSTDEHEFETFLDLPPQTLGRNALTNAMLKWPKGIIPYELGKNLTDDEKKTIVNAISIFDDKTCIKIIPKEKKHIDWLRFDKGEGCGTSVGYFKGQTSPHKLVMNEKCFKLPVAIQHETMHVMGIFHEQCRWDRDDYIEIVWENIPQEQKRNFLKFPQFIADTYGIEYDYESLMHYKDNAFAKKGTNVTMRVKNKDANGRNIVLGYVGGPTEKDFLKINRMYNCTAFL